jgi:hypothetical protein
MSHCRTSCGSSASRFNYIQVGALLSSPKAVFDVILPGPSFERCFVTLVLSKVLLETRQEQLHCRAAFHLIKLCTRYLR